MSDAHSTDFARQLELAWAAGFFDGEGCTHLSTYTRQGKRGAKTHSYVNLTIAQVNRGNLERFQKAVGAGTISGPRRHKIGQPFYMLSISSSRVKKVLGLLWPYLGSEKKAQGEEMLKVGEVGRQNIAERTHCVNGHPWVPENLYQRGSRKSFRCKTCCDAADLRYRMSHREAQRQKSRNYRARQKAQKEELKCQHMGELLF